MDLISPEWLAQNQEMHRISPEFGSGGRKNWKLVYAIAERYACTTILDYGCGKGGLRQKLGARVRNYDPAIPDWSAPPEPADMVVCRDVMEHVESPYIDAVLERIAGLAQRVALFTIAFRYASKSLPDGRNTHCSVHSQAWWHGKLLEHFRIADHWEADAEAGVFVCERKG